MSPPELSCAQRRYIENASPRSVLIARPGSGKTRVGVQRFLTRAQAGGSWGVAYLSFTNVAVNEAQRRASESGRLFATAPPNAVETLDAFIRNRIFDPFGNAFFGAQVPDIRIVEELGGVHRDLEANNAFKVFGLADYGVGAWTLRAVNRDGVTNFVTSTGHDIDVRHRAAIGKAKRAYLLAGFATYDDIRLWSLAILKDTKNRAAAIIANRFPEVIVDEAQDTTSIQQRLLVLLEEAGADVSYIGDPNQGIFEFNDAPAAYLNDLANSRERWDLTVNFRSTDKIVRVIRKHFNDPDMEWDRTCDTPTRGCFVCVIDPKQAIDRFSALIADAGVDTQDAVVVVRSRDLLRALRGEGGIGDLAPTVRAALLAWQRERNGHYQEAARDMLNVLRAVIHRGREPESNRVYWRSLAWQFLRGYLPEPGELGFGEWIDALRAALNRFAKDQGIVLRLKIGSLLKKVNLPEGTVAAMLRRPAVALRTSTIHGVKGESVGAVMVIGTTAQHKKWLSLDDAELRAIAYVAFTRAEELLVLVCPTEQIAASWRERGFLSLPIADG